MWRTIAGFVCAVSLLLALGGCGQVGSGSGNAAAHAVIVVAVDSSLPGFSEREQQLQMLDSIAKSASESGYVLDLWSYGASPSHLWGPGILESVDNLDSLENNQLKHVPATAKRACDPAGALTTISQATAASHPSTARIILITDGFTQLNGSSKALKAAAVSFGSRPDWSLTVLGMSPSNAPSWSAAFSPALGSRYQAVDQKQALSVLQQNRDM